MRRRIVPLIHAVLIAIWTICALASSATATPFTMTTPNGIALPAAYPAAGGVAMVMVGVNGNIYYQFSDPTGAFIGYQNTGTPAAFQGNPFTINNPIALNCGNSSCSSYLGGGIATMYIRFSASDGDTAAGNFDFNDIDLRMNGFTVGNWSTVATQITNVAGTTTSGSQTGFGDNTYNTGWFTTTDPALLANILSTGKTTTQVYDRDPNDNYWDFTIGNPVAPGVPKVIAPGYDLTKTSSTATYTAVGQVVTYTYVIKNTGSVDITGVTISDNKVPTITCNKTTIVATAFGATPDQATCTGTYTITQADVDAGSVTNNAVGKGTPTYGSLGTLTATRTITGPAAAPSLTLTKVAGIASFGNAGTMVPYTFTFRNTGNVTLTNVTVTDPKIPGLSCTVASLAPAAQSTCAGSYTVLQADVDAYATSGTQLTNTATVTGTAPSGSTVSTPATRSLPGPAGAPSLTVSKTSNPTVFTTPGAVLNFTITVVNTGNVTFPSAPAVTDGLVTGAGGSVSCPAGSVAPGASINCTGSYAVTQADVNAGGVTNTAVASITVAGVTASGSGAVTVAATRSPSLTIDKQAAAASPASFAAPGVGLSYIYVLKNTGNVTVSAPVVSDNKVAVSCPSGAILPGASVTCTSAVYTTTQADVNAGGVTNTAAATVTAPGSAGPVASSNTDQVTVPSVQSPALSMVKTAPVVPSGSFAPGLVVTYSYTVSNSGNVSLPTQVVVNDNKIGAPFNCGAPGLAPGASVTCTATYTVTAADVVAGLVMNRASASSGATTSNTDTATIPQAGTPDLALVKTANVANFTSVGQAIAYTFTVTNAGQTVIVNPGQPVTIADAKVTGITCTQPAVLSPGGSFTCTGSYSGVTQAEMDAGKVVNTATASFTYTSPGGATTVITSPSSTATVPAAVTPAVTLGKAASPVQFTTVGQVVTYTFTITNTGKQTLATATVSDPLIPALSCTKTNIAPNGGTATCTGTHAISQAEFDAGTLTNTASVAATTAAGGTATASGSATVTIAPGAGTKTMALVKSAAPASFTGVGQTIAYGFAVTNTGTRTLTGIAVTDPLIPSFSCAISTLAPGATNTTCSASYVTTQADVDAGQITNTATATAPGAPNATGSKTVNGPTRTPAMVLTKTGPASFGAVGQSVAYTFAANNTGNVTLTAIQITDPMIPTLACTAATLAPGATDASCTGSYVVTQADIDAGQITNTADFTATAPGPATITGTGTEVVAGPTQTPSLVVTKSEADASGGFGPVGSSEAYTFTVQNTGNVTLANLSITDPLTGFTCPLANLAPGATATTCANAAPLSGSVAITQAIFDAGTLTNTASATGQGPGGATASDTATLTLSGPARTVAISLTKAAAAPLPPFTAPGQAINYSYLVTNSGNVTITVPVTISDDRIAAVNCPAAPVAGIAPGGTLTCTASYTVTQADIDAGGITNTATATVAQSLQGQPTPVTATATDSATVAATQLPAMTLAKSIKAGTPAAYGAVGDVLAYDFRVTNTGNTTITGPIQINDDHIVPAFSCVTAPLAPGASGLCQATYMVTQSDIDAGSVLNTANAFTGPAGSPTLQSPPDTASAFAQQSPGLSVAKSTTQTAPSDFVVGNVISYSYTLTNTGNVTIPSPLAVSDTRIASVTCPTGSLAPNGVATCSGAYTITANDIALGSVTNNASAVATFAGQPVPTTTASVTIPSGAAPTLSITKAETSGLPITATGQVLTYQYVVTNTGNASYAADVTVVDDRISGAVLCFDSQGGTQTLNTQASGLAPFQATCTANYTVTQADVDAAGVTNTAYAQSIYAPLSPTPTPVQSPPQSVTVTASTAPALTTVKTVTAGPNPAAAGAVLTYTVTTTNTGNQTVAVITVTDPKIPTLSCTIGGNPAPAVITLAPAQVLVCTGSYVVTQADIDAQTLGNSVTVDGVSPQGTPITTTVTNTYPVTPAVPAMTVAKSVLSPATSPKFTGVGDVITYQVTVSNTGNVTLAGTTVTDPLVPATTCTIGPLAPGASDNSCQFSYTATQADVDAGAISNTATAVAQPSNPGAPTISGQGTVVAPGPAAAPTFLLSKSANVPSLITAGQVITYTYDITNASNVTIRGVPNVIDNKIGTFTCGGGPLAPGAATQCTAQYTVLLSDLNNGSLTNIATASAPAVAAGGGFPASPAIPASAPASVTLLVVNQAALTLTKSVLSQTELFPTVWRTTFAIDAANTGNLTLSNLDIQDDLAAFVAPATLLSAQYPVVTRVAGFATATANAAYDGTSAVSLLNTGAAMNPGEVGHLEIDVTYSTQAGSPAAPNTAMGLSPILSGPVTASAVASMADSDGDGVPDTLEACSGADRDSDGICDAQDYDPTGYFYCEDDGSILIGGSISVSGPAGTQTGVGTSNNITILRDGSTGSYQFFVTAAGVYTLTPIYPPGAIPSSTRVPTPVPVDVTGFATNPAVLGSTEFGATGRLANFTAAANTPSYLVFDIQAGDPHIIGNNLAASACAGLSSITATKSASVGTAHVGDSVGFTLNFTNGTSATASGLTFVDMLPAGMVYTPGSARVNGAAVEPSVSGNRLIWSPNTLTAGQTDTIVLTVRIGGNVAAGTLINSGWVESASGQILSNIAKASVRIEPEHVFDCSDIIGKVFDDHNLNGYQEPGEDGMPGVRIATLRGSLLTTDEHGRYHVPCAELPPDIGTNFTLKLDPRSLPSGYRVTTENPRTIRVTAGKMAKLNFGVAIGRVVDVDLSARAFETGTNDPKPGLTKGIDDLVTRLVAQPSILRLSYLQATETMEMVVARLDVVEKMLRDAWRTEGRYKLNIERTIKRVQ